MARSGLKRPIDLCPALGKHSLAYNFFKDEQNSKFLAVAEIQRLVTNILDFFLQLFSPCYLKVVLDMSTVIQLQASCFLAPSVIKQLVNLPQFSSTNRADVDRKEIIMF